MSCFTPAHSCNCIRISGLAKLVSITISSDLRTLLLKMVSPYRGQLVSLGSLLETQMLQPCLWLTELSFLQDWQVWPIWTLKFYASRTFFSVQWKSAFFLLVKKLPRKCNKLFERSVLLIALRNNCRAEKDPRYMVLTCSWGRSKE